MRAGRTERLSQICRNGVAGRRSACTRVRKVACGAGQNATLIGSPVRFTEFSIRNALVVAAVTMALAFLGLYAYGSMGVGITPNVSFPLVLVTTTDPGADPATIESQITKPIEDAVASLPNVDAIT